MLKRKALIILLSILSASILALALPNDFLSRGSPALGLIALVPLFVGMALSPSPRMAFAAGAVFGAMAHGLTSYWLWFFRDFRLWTLGSTVVVYAIVYGGLFAWISCAVRLKPRWRVLAFPVAWTAYEFMKSIGFLAYPWMLSGYSWNTVDAMNQYASINGVYGISFSVCVVNAILSEAVLRIVEIAGAKGPSPRRSLTRAVLGAVRSREFVFLASLAVLAIALPCAFGAWRLSKPEGPSRILRAVVVQAFDDSWVTSSEDPRLAANIALSEKAIKESGKKPDLLVWSETTLDFPYDDPWGARYESCPKDRPLKSFIAETGVPFITGAPKVLRGKGRELLFQNSAMYIGADARYIDYYAKMHPVPFAECIPFYEYSWMKRFMRDVVGLPGGWQIGDELTLFEIPLASGGSVRAGTPICFEDSFADLCRDFSNTGSEIMINLTNMSWSLRASAEIQQVVSALYRPIETGRPLLRSTNGGVTCWIDPKGRIHDALPLFARTSALLEVPVPAKHERTIYSLGGDSFAWLCLFIFAVPSSILIIARRKELYGPARLS